MNHYTIEFIPASRKDLKKLPEQVKSRVWKAIQELAEDPRPHGYVQLTEFDFPSIDPRNFYRIRVGDYRIIYTIEEQVFTVTIVKINHRSKVYRKR